MKKIQCQVLAHFVHEQARLLSHMADLNELREMNRRKQEDMHDEIKCA